MFEGMEKIGCDNTNYYIKKETKTHLTLVKMVQGSDVPLEVVESINSPYLSLPTLEREKSTTKRRISGEAILIPFDMEKIEELSSGAGTKRRKIKYKD